MKNVDEFKAGLFSLRTRTLWDIMNLYLTHNYTGDKLITVRVSVARGVAKNKYDTLYDKVVKTNSYDDVLYSNTEQDYLCNFQQLKVNEIRNIVYCVLFKNKIEVFEVSVNDIDNVPNIYYKQHRDNTNESQFAIKRSNIDWHRANTKKYDLSYEDLCDFAYKLYL